VYDFWFVEGAEPFFLSSIRKTAKRTAKLASSAMKSQITATKPQRSDGKTLNRDRFAAGDFWGLTGRRAGDSFVYSAKAWGGCGSTQG
jgi:hypothetical protein